MRYGDLTYLEIHELAQAGAVAIIPCGRVQPQGLHLPVDVDVWLADVLCQAAAERAQAVYQVPALVLPAIPYGPLPEHPAAAGGALHVPEPIHAGLLAALLTALAAQGFRRILVWRGCEQADLDGAVAAFNARSAGQARALLPEQPFREAWCALADPADIDDPTSTLATAIALYMRPEDVRTGLLAGDRCAAVPAPEGSAAAAGAGIPRTTAATGRLLWASLVERLVETIAAAAEDAA